jgi:hypothetical protein
MNLDSQIMAWSQCLLGSYEHLLGKPLLKRQRSPRAEAEALFNAPFVVVSHGLGGDPIFNYGNQTALDLWEVSWEELIRTPSRQTAELPNQAERSRLLAEVARQGYVEDYEGVRISKTGRRFAIKKATVWNVVDGGGRYRGQAATFQHWQFL